MYRGRTWQNTHFSPHFMVWHFTLGAVCLCFFFRDSASECFNILQLGLAALSFLEKRGLPTPHLQPLGDTSVLGVLGWKMVQLCSAPADQQVERLLRSFHPHFVKKSCSVI